MEPIENFKMEVKQNIEGLRRDRDILGLSRIWSMETNRYNYTYNFSWLGRPIIQYPQDMIALQELMWEVKPELVIETGIAHGGSLMLSASMLSLIDICKAIEGKIVYDPNKPRSKVIGIDIDIRLHNRKAIEEHPLSNMITMIEGSSISKEVIEKVHAYAKDFNNILICLDSMHTHEHVLSELEAYTPLLNKGSYCVVFDTLIEDLPDDMFKNKPWGKGNNPKTAVKEFLKNNKSFEIDKEINDKLLISVAPDGYLKRIN